MPHEQVSRLLPGNGEHPIYETDKISNVRPLTVTIAVGTGHTGWSRSCLEHVLDQVDKIGDIPQRAVVIDIPDGEPGDSDRTGLEPSRIRDPDSI